MLREKDFKEILEKKLHTALFENIDFNEQQAVSSIKNFYRAFGLEVPSKYFIYENVQEVIQEFDVWSSNELSAVNSWNWQFPMTSPGFSMMYLLKGKFHLAHKNKNPLDPSNLDNQEAFDGSNDVPASLIKEMWSTYIKLTDLHPVFDLLESSLDELYDVELIADYLDSLLDKTSQESSSEVFFIGTDFKLVYEVAVFEYLIKFHDIKRYSSYIDCLNNILKNCGLVISFKDRFVICKRKTHPLKN
ncbi:protein of unknown function [Tenacibaculum sp. 190130A14a]|uniref:Uncharacterized protein n=1 Tax=Tenacibaculum polynesiense TaxID=3137857 RepID=A0ABP1EUN9_9FLAO